MIKHVLITLDEVSMFSQTLEHDLTRIDDTPVEPQRLLERVNAMIECLIDAADQPRRLEDIYDHLVEEYGECLSALDILEELMAVCQHHLKRHGRTSRSRLSGVRVLDRRGDVVLTIT